MAGLSLSYEITECRVKLDCCDGACESQVRGELKTRFTIKNPGETPLELTLLRQRLTRDPPFSDPQQAYVGWQDGGLNFPPNIPTEPTYDPDKPFNNQVIPLERALEPREELQLYVSRSIDWPRSWVDDEGVPHTGTLMVEYELREGPEGSQAVGVIREPVHRTDTCGGWL